MQNNKSFTSTLNRAFPTVSPEVLPRENEVKFPKILEENVGNFCPSCGKTIFSNLLEIDDKVYLEKNCCTKELIFMENDVEFFKKYKNNTEITPPVPDAKNFQETVFKKPNHATNTVLLYITTRCQMDCPICYLKFQNQNYLNKEGFELSLPEIKKKIEKYQGRLIYLFGGEPTVREDLPEIIKAVKDSGNTPAITTNGLKLENKNYVKKLKKAGLNYIMLQFDGFNRETNIRLRGWNYLEKKLKALENLREVGGFRINLLAVIERGRNEDEVSNIIRFALKNESVDSLYFGGLTPPESEYKTATTRSDLIKIMEKEGYFDREYYLELVKMYRNIYEIVGKIFARTPLEDWKWRKVPSNFSPVFFKREINSPQLLFGKEEIEKINEIFNEAMNKKGKAACLFSLLKNSRKLIKSPLTTLYKKRFSIFNKAGFNQEKSSSDKLLDVGFYELSGPSKKLLKNSYGLVALFNSTYPIFALMYA